METVERRTKVHMAYSLLTCSSQAISCLSYRTSFLAVTCCLCRDMPLQKLSGVAIFASLQECVFFQPITLHRTPNSPKSRNKIRLAFHFVERNNVVKLLPKETTLKRIDIVLFKIIYVSFSHTVAYKTWTKCSMITFQTIACQLRKIDVQRHYLFLYTISVIRK